MDAVAQVARREVGGTVGDLDGRLGGRRLLDPVGNGLVQGRDGGLLEREREDEIDLYP